jgi:hypothetical protein
MNKLKWFHVLFVLALAFVLCQCAPPPTATPTSPPTQAASPTTQQVASPTQAPVVVQGWSSTASDSTELSFRYPGEWIGAARLPFGDGVYVKNPDQQIGVIFQIKLAGDPEQLLTDWGTSPIDIVSLLSFTPESATDGEPVTISRLDVPTKVAQGGGLTAQAAYVQRPEDVLGLIWFAPSDQWDAMQADFEKILASVEIWQKYPISQYGLQTMYLHDWPQPGAAWDGDGIEFKSADEQTGLALWTREIADPIQLLAAWQPEALAGLGLTGFTAPTPGDQFSGLNGQWDSVTGECTNASGGQTTYATSYLPNRDRVLEVTLYAPSDEWDSAWKVFSTMLSMLVDIR